MTDVVQPSGQTSSTDNRGYYYGLFGGLAVGLLTIHVYLNSVDPALRERRDAKERAQQERDWQQPWSWDRYRG